ncbi:vWA domain-containing protein [Aeromonas veronii]|uniref:vWA domain-containing protein n=1 Tax=Aeromonas veronii TaxID=654 RepID=UPI0018F22ABA|nr:VWA domain-containing protein [Aeromonas veronii]MBJ7582371.1 VWA domain-containing protein [Aeromonas veronii]MEB5667958.1 VWA domain-containing protein [Aeromonas veronii]
MLDAGLEFAHPHYFWLLPLPLLVFRLIPAYRTRQSAIKVPFFDLLIDLLDEPPREGATQLTASWWQRIALITVWLLAVLALAKPTIYGPPQVRERFGRDVMIVLDLSGSMAETDFSPDPGKSLSRLDAAKEVLKQFAAMRKGDRLGLILFGDAAFLQAPFTADLDTWQTLLQETDVAMAGQSTHLGDAIGLAIKVFNNSDRHGQLDQNSAKREKVAIILTDGNDTGSFVSPRDAARVAAVNGVRLHTIAMGDPATVGEQALDLDTLQQLATLTGGQLFQALDEAQLTRAYQVIGELEPQRYESTRFQTRESLHHYLIAVSVVLYLTLFSLLTLRRYRLRTALSGDTP